jgi:AcrR family transcriptional regulator
MSTRMSAEDRREQILVAATRAFSRGGYAGTSTDAVAKEAGVSQPYVVRTFGTKLALFLEVFERSCGQVALAFEEVLEAGPFDPEDDEDWGRLGLTYTELLRDRDLLMVMMHGFAAGDIDEVASRAREGMGRIYATVMRTGCSQERAVDFFAQGMLLNVMLSMRAPEHLEADALLTPLTHCAFGDSLELLS